MRVLTVALCATVFPFARSPPRRALSSSQKYAILPVNVCFASMGGPGMSGDDERQIEQLLGELTNAWNRGDANAYGARYLADATFTNANGSFYLGRDEFDRRHEEIFRGVLRGTTLAMTIRQAALRSPRRRDRRRRHRDLRLAAAAARGRGRARRPVAKLPADGASQTRRRLVDCGLSQCLARRAGQSCGHGFGLSDCAIAIFGFCAPHA